MQNPEKWLTVLGEQLLKPPVTATGRLHICAYRGSVEVRPANHCTERHKVFTRINSTDAPKGLTLREWSKLASAVAKFQEEAESWNPPSKP